LKSFIGLILLTVGVIVVQPAVSKNQNGNRCADVGRAQLRAAMSAADDAVTGGYSLNMWLVMVDQTGSVCHVLNSSDVNGEHTGNVQWLGSRVIAAQKAYTANAFSLDGYAISTANLFTRGRLQGPGRTLGNG